MRNVYVIYCTIRNVSQPIARYYQFKTARNVCRTLQLHALETFELRIESETYNTRRESDYPSLRTLDNR